MEKHYSDNGRGRDKNSCQVEAGVAMLAQGQAEKQSWKKRDSAADRHLRVREHRSKWEKLCSCQGRWEGPFSETPFWSCCIPVELDFLYLDAVWLTIIFCEPNSMYLCQLEWISALCKQLLTKQMCRYVCVECPCVPWNPHCLKHQRRGSKLHYALNPFKPLSHIFFFYCPHGLLGPWGGKLSMCYGCRNGSKMTHLRWQGKVVPAPLCSLLPATNL